MLYYNKLVMKVLVTRFCIVIKSAAICPHPQAFYPPSGLATDPLTEVIRAGVRTLIEQAIHAELAALMASFRTNGLMTSERAWCAMVTCPHARDREAGADKITFTPSILPRYLRKAKSIEELLPWLYLKGVSTGDSHRGAGGSAGARSQGAFCQDDHAAEG